jgi:hypothetical protein
MYAPPGQALIAYGTADLTSSGLNTDLFLGSPESLASATPVLSLTNDKLGAIVPLYIKMEGGKPIGVWFTKRAYGIGGDIIFDPTRGLFMLDPANGQVQEYNVGETIYSPSLSPSANWLAYSSRSSSSEASTLKIRQITTLQQFTFPLLADSDRGAGSAVFSPDDLHVAWMEGHGSNMGDTSSYRGTVRLGGTDGSILHSYSASDFDHVAGLTVSWAEPVGWLDNDSLVVQVSDAGWKNPLVLRVSISGTVGLLSKGMFIGLTYP